MKNVEIKVRCDDLNAVHTRAVAAGGLDAGVLVQRDTYFHTPQGRLKLREIDGEQAELIAYHRPDAEIRTSDYRVIPIDDPAAIIDALSITVGVRVVVEKRRDLVLIDNVRVHLDRVARLGNFVELEAVVDDRHDEPTCRAQVDDLVDRLQLNGEVIGGSYSELLLKQAPSAS